MVHKYRKSFISNNQNYDYYDIADYLQDNKKSIIELPYTLRILLEALLRHSSKKPAMKAYLPYFCDWQTHHQQDIPFKPERVILQDFTGVPALVDLATMRDEMQKKGGNPAEISPDVPVHLIIDHSVQVDMAGNHESLEQNIRYEFQRNQERYLFLKWAQESFSNLTIIPPDTGIVHQVNLEYLSPVIQQQQVGTTTVVYPDTLVGTDSHTTMINSLGVLGWGVGGIEAEASMLGQESYFPLPKVIGVKLVGNLNETTTATDLALKITAILREKNVVGKFVEFYGPGIAQLSLGVRGTIANMAPEYGATCGFFPIDKQTLAYLTLTNRSKKTSYFSS